MVDFLVCNDRRNTIRSAIVRNGRQKQAGQFHMQPGFNPLTQHRWILCEVLNF